jgi:hypothetical protein
VCSVHDIAAAVAAAAIEGVARSGGGKEERAF